VSLRLAATALAGLVVVAGAGARSIQDPGVTPATVLLGGTVPLTGEAAAFGSVGAGAKAYFETDTLMLFATPKFFIQAVVPRTSSRGDRASTSRRCRSSPGSWQSPARTPRN